MLRAASRGLLRIASTLALAAGAVASQTGDPPPSDAEWAQALVDHPVLAQGWRDGAVLDWLAMLESWPEHPLAEPTLALVAAVLHDVADPPALRERLLELDAEALAPLARGRLLRLQGWARGASAEAAVARTDCHPDVLSAWRVLGPVGSLEDPTDLAIDEGRLADPGFGAAHDGPEGPVRWHDLPRSPLGTRVDPDLALSGNAGWLLLAASFDVAGGGPAWIEFDLTDAATDGGSRPDAVFAFGGTNFRGSVHGGQPLRLPGYTLGLAGGEQTRVDLASADRSAVQREPVVLRDGRNVLLMRVPLGARVRPLARVLAPDGSPHPHLTPGLDERELGRAVSGQPPAHALPGGVPSSLRAPTASAHENALAGLLLALDQRPAEGLLLLEQAADRGATAGLYALAAAVLEHTAHLPASWRRSRSRELVERGLALNPDHLFLSMGLAARDLALDRHEQAIDVLTELGSALPQQPWSHVQLGATYAALGLPVESRLALEDAERRAPRSASVLGSLLGLARSSGRSDDAAEFQRRLVDATGRTAARLSGLGRVLLERGQLAEGLAAMEESLLRSPTRQRRASFAGDLMALDRLDEAERELLRLADEDPTWMDPLSQLADLARLRGDADGEARWLGRVLVLRPGMRPARERLAERDGASPDADWHAAFALDGGEVIAAYDDAGRDDSVVRLLDEALVRVFPDGAMETLTHEIMALRDLAACDDRGAVRLRGEVLDVATVKPDGRRFEPVLVGGEYIMPNLEPGDLIETRVRSFDPPPAAGVLRPGGWFFRSTDEPFLVSRYVVRLPTEWPLRLETRAYDGLHEMSDWDGDTVHVFETRDGERVLPEVGAPPGNWFLPWVELGMDADGAADLHRQQLLWLPEALATPRVAARAHELVAGVEGQEARARALHAFVGEHLDQRGSYPVSAESTLLAKEGNPTLLYAALLDAVGIAHELVLSRAVTPAADPDRDPPFVEPGRLARRMLILVRPDDGPEAWCDLTSEGLPYGWTLGDAPGAEAVALRSGEPLREPDVRPSGTSVSLTFRLAGDGSAEVEGQLTLLGAGGQLTRKRLAEVPEAWHRSMIQNAAASQVPGIDLTDHGIDGLDEGQQPSFRFTGRLSSFLDADGGRALPLIPLELSRGLAGEGARRLPYLSGERSLGLTEVIIELPAEADGGPKLVDALPAGLAADAQGWSYLLEVEALSPRRLRMTRRFAVHPFHVEADGFGELVAMAAQVDAAERARLRLAPSAGSSDGAGGR
jgi:tetratricopeptide (TPR) repeat protein